MTPCVVKKEMNELCNNLKSIYQSETLKETIESVNSCLRKVTNGKGSFVSVQALEKVFYLRIKELSKKWNRSTKENWEAILNELLELFGERVEHNIEI